MSVLLEFKYGCHTDQHPTATHFNIICSSLEETRSWNSGEAAWPMEVHCQSCVWRVQHLRSRDLWGWIQLHCQSFEWGSERWSSKGHRGWIELHQQNCAVAGCPVVASMVVSLAFPFLYLRMYFALSAQLPYNENMPGALWSCFHFLPSRLMFALMLPPTTNRAQIPTQEHPAILDRIHRVIVCLWVSMVTL